MSMQHMTPTDLFIKYQLHTLQTESELWSLLLNKLNAAWHGSAAGERIAQRTGTVT